MFSKIYNPHSKRMVNLKSKKGRKILYNYINYSNEFKGGSQSETDHNFNDIEFPSLNELHIFLQMLIETKDETLIDMYTIMLSECDTDPSKVIEKYMTNSKISYNGKYYLSGQLELIPEDKITPDKIQEVKDIRMTKGGPTNSAEAESIFRSGQELTTIETIIKHYIIIMTHIKFRPGGEGMKMVEADFNLHVSNGKNK